jgi:hypothetical protein
LIDGDAAELALIGNLFDCNRTYLALYFSKIDPSTFEELHKAAECLLNLQGVFYFGEEEHGRERLHSSSTAI